MFDNRDRRRLRRGTRAFAREVVVGEACVFVDHGFQWDGSNNVWLTRARATYVMQSGPRFDLRPRSLWNRLFGLGTRQAPLDPYFDAFFVVRTPAPAGTWEALTVRARTLLVGSFDDARLVSDGKTVTLWREGDFGREADAEAAAELVSEIVTWRTSALDPLRRLPGALYTPAAGRWDEREPPRVDLLASVQVQLRPMDLRGRPVIAVRAPCGRATAPFCIELDEPLGQTIASSEATDAADAATPGFGLIAPPGRGEDAEPTGALSPGARSTHARPPSAALPSPLAALRDVPRSTAGETSAEGPGRAATRAPTPPLAVGSRARLAAPLEPATPATTAGDAPAPAGRTRSPSADQSAPAADASPRAPHGESRLASATPTEPPARVTASPRRPSGTPPLPIWLVEAAHRLGAARLACDGHWVTLYWGRLESDRERLLAGARLVGAFASENLGGLYR